MPPKCRKLIKIIGAVYGQLAVNAHADFDPTLYPFTIVPVRAGWATLSDKGFVITASRADGLRPAATAKLFAILFGLFSELIDFGAIESFEHIAQARPPAAGEALAQKEAPCGTDRKQPNAGSAGMALHLALMRYNQQINQI